MGRLPYLGRARVIDTTKASVHNRTKISAPSIQHHKQMPLPEVLVPFKPQFLPLLRTPRKHPLSGRHIVGQLDHHLS
jgi:hypothetical protein